MLLAFNQRSLENIRLGRKHTTVRQNAERWLEWWSSDRRKEDGALLQVYAGNPRSGGKLVAETRCLGVRWVPGTEFTRELARIDGLDSVAELIAALMEIYNATKGEITYHIWAVIEFDPKPIMVSLNSMEGVS